mgnify:CR=1 FL=1
MSVKLELYRVFKEVAEAGNISVRDRKGETTEMSLEDFIAKVTTEIRTRSL